jgi:pimeloyl-ACP methyl ester carboxylesterase
VGIRRAAARGGHGVVTRLATGAEARVTNPGGRRAVVCVDGGTGRELPGTWSATLEWLVRRLAPDFPGLTFLEVRYRIKSWRKLDWCIDDCRAAISLAVEDGAETLALLGFSMGGAVAIAAADHSLVTTVVGLAPWIPDRLDVSTLDGRRLAIVHGALDRWLPGIPGVSPKSSLRGFARIRAREVDATHTIVSGGLHGLAVRSRRGGTIPLPRAGHWAKVIADELCRFESG